MTQSISPPKMALPNTPRATTSIEAQKQSTLSSPYQNRELISKIQLLMIRVILLGYQEYLQRRESELDTMKCFLEKAFKGSRMMKYSALVQAVGGAASLTFSTIGLASSSSDLTARSVTSFALKLPAPLKGVLNRLVTIPNGANLATLTQDQIKNFSREFSNLVSTLKDFSQTASKAGSGYLDTEREEASVQQKSEELRMNIDRQEQQRAEQQIQKLQDVYNTLSRVLREGLPR